jgi:hypothetical protein
MNQQQPPRYEVPATERTGIAAHVFLRHFAKTSLAVLVGSVVFCLLGYLVWWVINMVS